MTYSYDTPAGTLTVEAATLPEALVRLRAEQVRRGWWGPFAQATTVRRTM